MCGFQMSLFGWAFLDSSIACLQKSFCSCLQAPCFVDGSSSDLSPITVVQPPQILLRVYRVASTPRYKLCIRRNEQGNLTTFFAGQLGTWDAHARAQLDEPLSPEILEVGKGDEWGALYI